MEKGSAKLMHLRASHHHRPLLRRLAPALGLPSCAAVARRRAMYMLVHCALSRRASWACPLCGAVRGALPYCRSSASPQAWVEHSFCSPACFWPAVEPLGFCLALRSSRRPGLQHACSPACFSGSRAFSAPACPGSHAGALGCPVAGWPGLLVASRCLACTVRMARASCSGRAARVYSCRCGPLPRV